MPYEILYKETFGENDSNFVYVKPPESYSVVRLDSSLSQSDPRSSFQGFFLALKEVFLPRGYPSSVSPDYITYQLWDTLQAACSTIAHALTTEAILKGMGVGDMTASTLSAAITWILKDGIGMVSRIGFAWFSGCGLDSECKKWRLFADILNDLAMLVELAILPLIPTGYFLHVMSLSTSMKAIVGVAGGATRAAVTQHQAIKENMGDVSAKDSSQETCVNLIASIIGICILSWISGSRTAAWCIFGFVISIHLYANYRCVKSLIFNTLNTERHNIILKQYLHVGGVPLPSQVSSTESVILGFGLSDRALTGCRITMGDSLAGLTLTPNQLKLLTNLYKGRQYLIVNCDSDEIRVCLSSSHSSSDAICAYFHASLLAVCSSFANNTYGLNSRLGDASKFGGTLMSAIAEMVQNWPVTQKSALTIDQMMEVDQLVTKEFPQFLKSLEESGWTVRRHQLHSIDKGWRGSWHMKQSFLNDERENRGQY